ncbi:MAG: hypothetical protein Q4A19_05300 [Johnsonella sp.]|nr:hypothetical protein [Johnsonella sp.]
MAPDKFTHKRILVFKLPEAVEEVDMPYAFGKGKRRGSVAK